jgi:SAM-dependent methyltransferase
MPTEEPIPNKGIIFPESKLAHQILDGLEGLEIGPASHNPFGLKTRNVGLTPERDAQDYEFFKQIQLENCGTVARIDIPADAADLPIRNDGTDFVLHSHVWEHLPNPLAALDEWVRVVRPRGYIFVIVPKRDAAPPDKDRPLSSITELLQHYGRRITYADRIHELGGTQGHYTLFSPELLKRIGVWFNQSHFWARLDEVAYQETDDKVGNGHTIVWQVRKFSIPFGCVSASFSQITMRLRHRKSAS